MRFRVEGSAFNVGALMIARRAGWHLQLAVGGPLLGSHIGLARGRERQAQYERQAVRRRPAPQLSRADPSRDRWASRAFGAEP